MTDLAGLGTAGYEGLKRAVSIVAKAVVSRRGLAKAAAELETET